VALYRIVYSAGTGSLSINSSVSYNGLTATGRVLSYASSGATGSIVIDGNQVPTPSASIFDASLLAFSATIESATAITTTAHSVALRDPGAKFNIKLQDTVLTLTGAYWGIKVTLQ